MSKSRGNAISVDEVTNGVASLDPNCEFRDAFGAVIEDFRALGVWHDKAGNRMYYTASRFGKMPVFLHGAGNPVPALLMIDGVERLQHERAVLVNREGEKIPVWDLILARIGDDK